MSDTPALVAPSRSRNYTAWGLQGVLALAFLGAAGFKLSGAAQMVQLFDQLGVGQWFRIVTGLVEAVGAVGLIVPGFAGPAALWLGFTMVCATVVHVAVLHSNPAPAVVLVVLCGVVAYLRAEQITAWLPARR